jgi:hypothetical protein
VYDSRTATSIRDAIKVLRINTLPDSAESLFYSQTWRINNRIVESDGFEDNRKILITFPDDNLDGVPDNPDLFTTLVEPDTNPATKFVYFVQSIDENNFVRYDPVLRSNIVGLYATETDILNKIDLYSSGTIFYAYTEDKFYETNGTALTVLTNHVAFNGRENLIFQYSHNAPNSRRIDPSPNNIIDLFLLTADYSDQYVSYITDSSNTVDEPVAPSSNELYTEFGTIENYKSISDSIIYNTATFKPLFGTKADPALRATFKVVKNPAINISDNEIKSQVIATINNYFDIDNWEFGESFYFSELSAYLHSELTPNISSIIIVPTANKNSFGNLYQINAEPNEILISAATVDDVQIISAITAGQLNRT